MNGDDTQTPEELIDLLYRLQASLKMLTEHLARQPDRTYALPGRLIDYLYLSDHYFEQDAGIRRH